MLSNALTVSLNWCEMELFGMPRQKAATGERIGIMVESEPYFHPPDVQGKISPHGSVSKRAR